MLIGVVGLFENKGPEKINSSIDFCFVQQTDVFIIGCIERSFNKGMCPPCSCVQLKKNLWMLLAHKVKSCWSFLCIWETKWFRLSYTIQHVAQIFGLRNTKTRSKFDLLLSARHKKYPPKLWTVPLNLVFSVYVQLCWEECALRPTMEACSLETRVHWSRRGGGLQMAAFSVSCLWLGSDVQPSCCPCFFCCFFSPSPSS